MIVQLFRYYTFYTNIKSNNQFNSVSQVTVTIYTINNCYDFNTNFKIYIFLFISPVIDDFSFYFKFSQPKKLLFHLLLSCDMMSFQNREITDILLKVEDKEYVRINIDLNR